jgi:hypothetical protein
LVPVSSISPVSKFAAAWRDAPAEDLTEEQVEARYREWWGSAYDANYRAAARVWDRLTHAERVALTPRRGDRRVMDEIVKLERLGAL